MMTGYLFGDIDAGGMQARSWGAERQAIVSDVFAADAFWGGAAAVVADTDRGAVQTSGGNILRTDKAVGAHWA